MTLVCNMGFDTNKIYYHGTDEEFTSFSKSSIGKSTDTGMFGEGFYFTDDKSYAKSYAPKTGNVVEVELNLKNPYIINSKEDIPEIDTPEETMKDLENGDSNYSKAFTKHLQDLGYDGVIDNINKGQAAQYVVFNENQIIIKGAIKIVYASNKALLTGDFGTPNVDNAKQNFEKNISEKANENGLEGKKPQLKSELFDFYEC